MAIIIPSTIPSRSSQGEKDMHALLSRLPDDCIAYFEPDVGGRRPDFVVICPTLGLFVIEVKGWFPTHIQSGDQEKVCYLRDEHTSVEVHPVRQARNYVNRLLSETKKPLFAQHLTHHAGPQLGRLLFPIGHVAVLSNMTDFQLDAERPNQGALRQIFPTKNVVSRNDLKRWMTLEPEELLAEFARYFDPTWSFPAMSALQIKALRGLIHPEIFFDSEMSPEVGSGMPEVIREDSELLKVLDLRQEDFALSIGAGHRVIYGVAGSGKTLILLSRAKAILQANPEARVLLMCYNRTLAAWLRVQLRAFPGVTVDNFHRWSYANGVPFQSDSDSDTGVKLLAALQGGARDSAVFDAVLVDEAQDFESNWFPCLLAAMKDPVDGDLVIVADGSQSIYKRSKIRWSDLGIKAQGRTISTRFHLDRNYRNTAEIVTAATEFLAAAESSDDVMGDEIQSLPTDVNLCIRKSGALPSVMHCETRHEELVQAYRWIEDLMAGRWNDQDIAPLSPHEIGILYPSSDHGEKEQLAKFVSGLKKSAIPICWLNDPADRRARDSVNEAGVKLQTIQSSKGLQYRAVILVWVDKLPNHYGASDPEQVRLDRRQLYVGMTRAETFLGMTASRKSNFMTDLIDSQKTQSSVRYVKPLPERDVRVSTPPPLPKDRMYSGLLG